MLQRIVFALSAFFVFSMAFAQDDPIITVAANSSSGTYHKMLTEITGVCSEVDVKEAQGIAGGAPGNLEALVNNKVQAAFLHSDVYVAQSMADSSYAKYQTLIALYPEPIHVLALRQSKTSKLGKLSFGTQDFSTLSDMTGFSVGAAGGGVYTAKILSGQGRGGFNVVAFETGDDVIRALRGGQVAAAIFVGAAPLPNIEKLSGSEFKLLPIGESIASQVGAVYRPATISYRGLTMGPLKTLAPVATLLTKRYNTGARIETQRAFRQCFYKHLGELKDNGSPNWESVEEDDHGVPSIPWYNIPDTQSAAVSRKVK